MIHQQTHDEQLDERLARPDGVSLYCGFDPSADSLHVGNLIPMMGLAFFLRHGHTPTALVGGATGMIGDPSGKSEERVLLDAERIEHNLQGIRQQLHVILNRALTLHPEGVQRSSDERVDVDVVNNASWMNTWSYIDFLREIGKHFSVNQMMARDSVRTRLNEREQGISYTEFSYMLIQSYDFLHLFEEHGCALQLGGSDQWGNITAGTDLIRRSTGKMAYGLTLPLLTTAEGKKFGKSESGAVFLSTAYTSPYKFYQYWVNQNDADMPSLLRTFTFLPKDQVDELLGLIERGENRNEVQRALAYEVTALVHGVEVADSVVVASKLLFSEDLSALEDSLVHDIFEDAPSSDVPRAQLAEGIDLIDLLVQTGMQKGKGAARRLLGQGGVYINNARVEDEAYSVTSSDLLTASMLVLRCGKRKYHAVRVVED